MGFKTKTGVKRSQKKSHEQVRNRSSGKEEEEGACVCVYVCMYREMDPVRCQSKNRLLNNKNTQKRCRPFGPRLSGFDSLPPLSLSLRDGLKLWMDNAKKRRMAGFQGQRREGCATRQHTTIEGTYKRRILAKWMTCCFFLRFQDTCSVLLGALFSTFKNWSGTV